MNCSRRRVFSALLAVALVAGGNAQAQGAAGAGAHTGDAWVDARLVDIGSYAATYRDAFVDELVRYHRAPRELVTELLARPGWTPGDVYLACSLAMQSGRPCRAVADLRQRDLSQDWVVIARDLGVAPDTPAYAELKRGIAASYLRWARPLPAEADREPAHATSPSAKPQAKAAAATPQHDPHHPRH